MTAVIGGDTKSKPGGSVLGGGWRHANATPRSSPSRFGNLRAAMVVILDRARKNPDRHGHHHHQHEAHVQQLDVGVM